MNAVLSTEVSARVRRRFDEFARHSPSAGLWRSVAARAVEPELPLDAYVPGDLSVLQSKDRLAQTLAGLVPRVRTTSAAGRAVVRIDQEADELWGFAETLDAAEHAALDVLLVRALHPTWSLRTWPAAELFGAAELAALDRLERRSHHEPQLSPLPAAAPLGVAEYAGYVCAIVKVTRLCNLRCHYCHDWRAGPGQRMPFHVQARLFRSLLSAPSHRVVDVVWHGGEPTVLGRQTFLRALALQDRFRRPGQVVRNRLQTNGTRLDDAWVAFLRRYQFQVSVSIDGPEPVHDAVRVDVRGRPTWSRVRAGVRALQQAGLLSQVLLVVTPALVAAGAGAVMAFLRREGLTNVGMLAMRPVAGAPATTQDLLPVATYTDFLLQVQDERLRHPDPWIAVREIDEPLRALDGRRPGHCEVLGGCVGTYFSIDPDGSVAHCDKFVGDQSYVLGNVLDDDFDALRTSARARGLDDGNRAAVGRWSSCPYVSVCQGWCPHERYVAEHQLGQAPSACCGLRPLLTGLASSPTPRGAGSGDTPSPRTPALLLAP